MKHVVFSLLSFFFLAGCATTQKVWHSSESVFSPNYGAFYCSALSDGGKLFIVISIKSERLQFVEDPVFKIKNFEGDILTIQGETLSSHTVTSGAPIYGLSSSGEIVPGGAIVTTTLSTMARFPISEEDIPFFEPGIMKVRISTAPIVHEKEFYQDYFGNWLYKELKKAKLQEDDF